MHAPLQRDRYRATVTARTLGVTVSARPERGAQVRGPAGLTV